MLVRLLIVDDDPLMVELLQRFMNPVCSFIDSTDTLVGAEEKLQSKEFNVVLLDLNLRGTGKWDAFHAIRSLKSHKVSVVVVSGILDPHLREDSMAAGADAFVQKSTDMNAHTLLLAANIAVLHLPHDSFHSESFTEHVKLLQQMVAA
jgi:DNA-binding NarL/FixJ family response regulator